MSNQIKAEWIKARSLRSTWILLAIALLTMVVGALTGVITFRHEGDRVQTLNALSGSQFTLVVLTILGVILSASEYGSKAIISTYTVTADRVRVILAKSVVAGLLGIAVGVLSVPIARLVAAVFFGFGGDGGWDADVGKMLHYGYGIVLAYAGFAVIGVFIGTLCRSVALGVGVAFVGIFIVDSMLGSISVYSEYALTSVVSVLVDPDVHQSRYPLFGSAIALLALYLGLLGFIASMVERNRDV